MVQEPRREMAIRWASRSVAKELFATLSPEALERLQAAEELAYTPALKRIKFGRMDETLWMLSVVFESIADALRVQADAISVASSPDQVQQIFFDGFIQQLSGRLNKEETVRFTSSLASTLEGQPSLVDRIGIPLIEEKRADCEERLERCVLKVIDPDDRAVSTAFALCNCGHILTAAHVAGEHSNLALAYQCKTIGTEIEGQAKVVHIDRQNDVAILQAEEKTWTRFLGAGLRPPLLAVRPENALRGLPVVCLGYQDSHVFIDPVGVKACTPSHFPVRRVRIEGFPYRCLVLVISEMEGQICITYGMSGGPVMDSRTSSCEVVAMVLGVWKPREDVEVRIYQPWRRRWEVVSAEAFGFAIPLSTVAESWPELKKCCLVR